MRQQLAEPATESHTQVERCLNFIHEHYAKDFPVEALAKTVYVSPSYLFRIFRKKMGVTPMHYRNLVRVDKAKLLLLDRTLKMEEVADRVGFEDAKYFARVFKKETGASPSEFRRRNGGTLEAERPPPLGRVRPCAAPTAGASGSTGPRPGPPGRGCSLPSTHSPRHWVLSTRGSD